MTKVLVFRRICTLGAILAIFTCEQAFGQAMRSSVEIRPEPIAARAKPRNILGRGWHQAVHYVRTHPELVAYDVVVVLGPLADAGTTMHCLHTSPLCEETDPIFPLRPSGPQIWGGAAAGGTGLVVAGQLLWHFLPRPEADEALGMIGGVVGTGEWRQARANVRLIEQLTGPGSVRPTPPAIALKPKK